MPGPRVARTVLEQEAEREVDPRELDPRVSDPRNLDPRAILRATIAALGLLDAKALESLRASAESISEARCAWDYAEDTAEAVAEAMQLKQTLDDLLHSTERSLRVLRGVHEGAIRRSRMSSLSTLSETLWVR